jgi:hypothetical protein
MRIVVPTLADLRRWTPAGLALRALLFAAAAGALALPAVGGGLPLVPVVVGLLGLLSAVIRPGGAGPAVVIGGAALGWILRYGTGAAPVLGTVLLALALAVHHQCATLAAAVPPGARIDRSILVRYGRYGGFVLALSVVVGVLALAAAPPAGSAPLELLAVAAVVVVVLVPVLLSRTGRPR